MLRSVLGKTLGFVGYAVQYGCIAHCTFEYVGEVVVVRIISITELIIFLVFCFSQIILIHLCTRNNCVFLLLCFSVLVHPWSPPLSTMISSSLNA